MLLLQREVLLEIVLEHQLLLQDSICALLEFIRFPLVLVFESQKLHSLALGMLQVLKEGFCLGQTILGLGHQSIVDPLVFCNLVQGEVDASKFESEVLNLLVDVGYELHSLSVLLFVSHEEVLLALQVTFVVHLQVVMNEVYLFLVLPQTLEDGGDAL